MSNTDSAMNHDIDRMKRLEGELQRLVAAVDARLSTQPRSRQEAGMPSERKSWLDKTLARRPTLMAALAGLGVVVFASGWIGSSLLYTHRLKAQVEDEIRPYAAELTDTIAAIQAELAPSITVADKLKAEIDQARRDLLARDDDLGATITEAQSQLLSIRDTAIDDIERRLSDQTDDLNLMLEASRQRATELDHGLSDIAQALDAFDRQLPLLTDSFGEISVALMESRERLDKTAEQMAGIDGRAPAFLDVLDEHRLAVDTGTETLTDLQAQIEALKTQTTQSSQELDQLMAEGQGRIEAWEDADQEIASRKAGIMRNLDQYADSLNARVREFIEALNVETTFTGG